MDKAFAKDIYLVDEVQPPKNRLQLTYEEPAFHR